MNKYTFDISSVSAVNKHARHTLLTHNTVHSATGPNTHRHVTIITALVILLVQTLSANAGEYNLQKLLGFKHTPLYEWVPATKTSSDFSGLLDNADEEDDPSIDQQILQAATEDSEVVSASDKPFHCILTRPAGVAQSVQY